MKILLTLMALDIGGVETHVLELAKELKNMGYDIVVASNGGVFVEELEQYGIKHYVVPLHSKKLPNIIKSVSLLCNIVKTEKVDVIHAHARIPAFLCGKIARHYKIPFVTSTHWVFKTGFLYNLLTDWGEKTVAVSEDIKKYLIDNYKFPAENIIVTINGIDTKKFAKNTDYTDVAKEFAMTGKNRIVYCSRMDADRAEVAFMLCEIAPLLNKKIQDLEIVIVGGGNVYDDLETLKNSVNTQVGRNIIKLTGARVDVNKFVASSNVFVGVSRAALEAMAAEKPTIIAGNEGYIGLFDKEKLPTSIKSNFTCRGEKPSSKELLLADILKYFNMEKSEQENMGKYCKKIVEEKYSVEKMAKDTEKLYLPYKKKGRDKK